MLDILNFVRGAVATKDLVPVLTHFHVRDGRIQGGNGRIAIDAPCEELKDFNFTVPAVKFLKSVDACNGEPKLKITPSNKLSVKKGAFKALLPLADNTSFPYVVNELTKNKLNTDLLTIFKKLKPFVGDDASRPWSCGILLRNNFAYATNNVVLAKVPIVWPYMDVNIPLFAVDELLRIGFAPNSIGIADNRIIFNFVDDSWLSTQLFVDEWPDVDPMFKDSDSISLIPNELKSAIETVLPFCPDEKFPRIKLSNETVSTDDGEMSAEVSGFNFGVEAYFRAEPLLQVLTQADEIDFSFYPDPCPFRGDGIEGILVGVRS